MLGPGHDHTWAGARTWGDLGSADLEAWGRPVLRPGPSGTMGSQFFCIFRHKFSPKMAIFRKNFFEKKFLVKIFFQKFLKHKKLAKLTGISIENDVIIDFNR